jgi:hypothetical protein
MGEMVSPVRNINNKGCSMKKFIPVIPMMLVIACSVYAQSEGVFRGQTSQQGQQIQFTVVLRGNQLCVDPMSFGVSLTCPSGGRTGWGAAYGGCNPIQKDGSFAVTLAPQDAAIVTYVVSGQFTSDTTAGGTISFQASHLRFPGEIDPVEAQLCDAGDVTWTADHTAGPSGALKFEGNEIIRSTDKGGNTATFYKLDPK